MNAILQPQYRLRPMQEADLDEVMRIEPTIYSHPWSRGNFADSLNSGYSAWVLTLGDEIIGYSLMMLVLDEAHLLNISVSKDYQQQGYGRVLLEHMIDRARHYKALNMFLEVRKSNIAAISLYENIGFNEMSIRRNYYPAHRDVSPSGREDAVLMGLAL